MTSHRKYSTSQRTSRIQVLLILVLSLAVVDLLCSIAYLLLKADVIKPHASNDVEFDQSRQHNVFASPVDNQKESSNRTTPSFADSSLKCANPPWNTTSGIYDLPEDGRNFFMRVGALHCMIEGTDELRVSSEAPPSAIHISGDVKQCPCKPGWHGQACSIPDSVRYSDYPWGQFPPVPRVGKPPRRIIQAFPFNIEFEMLDARLAELGDVVDVFLILESNYTAFGDPRPLRLLKRLQDGFYLESTCKIVRIFLDYFPDAAHSNGWIADDLTRNYISEHGIRKQLKNFSSDDLFLLQDADEVPSRDTLLFLKLHDRYPIPVGFHLKSRIFGFFWKNGETLQKFAGVTMGYLSRVFENRCIQIRSFWRSSQKHPENLNLFIKSHNGTVPVRGWFAGNKTDPAGWHCSWCGDLNSIRTKLVSAQNGDFPRWGDFPDKRNLTYIRSLVERGMWFDDKSTFVKVDVKSKQYAPNSILQNSEKYKHILYNPFTS